MDRSFQSPVFSNTKSSFDIRNSRLSSGSPLFGNKKSFQSLKKSSVSSRYSLSGRSNQTAQIIAKSENNEVKNYGLPLPVLVNEALTFTERNITVSISFAVNGWAWAVCGRRLLVWQYRESKMGSPKPDGSRSVQRRGATGQCRELTLPHCDIGHKASLMTVFVSEGQQMASCLAISPTGDVRYWPSIAHDGSSIDDTIGSEGQEFDELLSIVPHGYILATTTCNLVLLQLQLYGGRHTIEHKSVKPPSGFFGGISKKFASIIIGMHSGQDKENKLLKICTERSGVNDWIVSVMAEKWIQRWLFQSNTNELFLFEDFDFIRKVRENFHQKLWSKRDINEIEIWLLDMQSSDSDELTILCAALNISHTPQLHYGLITLSDNGEKFSINNFYLLKYNTFYSKEKEIEVLSLKFIINKNYAYVYSDKTIFPVFLNEPQSDEIEKIDFLSQGDKLMAGAVYNNLTLFFSKNFGLVCVLPSDFDSGDIFSNSIPSDVFQMSNISDSTTLGQSMPVSNIGNLTLYELDPEEMFSSSKDMINQLKAAFIYQLKRNTASCILILKELFPDDAVSPETDAPLDRCILKIAQDLAEDIPSADPRWEQNELNQKNALGSSASLQIVQQLREKNLAMNLFIDFLHSTKLWTRLSTVSTRGTIRPTCYLLSEINEKIVAGIALKCIHNNYSQIIDEAIMAVLENRKEQPYGNLTHQDIFYVKITKIVEIFKTLIDIMENYIKMEHSGSEISLALIDINTVILTVLAEVMRFREKKSIQYTIPAEKQNLFECLPWTAASGKHGLRDVLLQSINLTLKYGARGTGEPEIRQKHYQQLTELIDYVLDGRRNYLESIKDTEKYGVMLQQYESQRTDLIYSFIDDDQYELAAKLAEKYLDFQNLVIICDKTKNQSRLDEYIERYRDMDFSQFAINWHLRQNKQGDLFERFKRNQAALSKYLGDHPSLAWVQLIFNGELGKASKVLFNLAQNESELIGRKKTILSLSKLAALSADNSTSLQITEINAELNLIALQEQIPENILHTFGYDTTNPKVLKSEEIINLYISEENDMATEYDFRTALELLSYVEDPLEVRYKIWCAAILRDSWSNYNANSPLEDMQNMMFFKLIDCCYLMDGMLEDFLPSIEDFLHAPELGKLTDDKSFQFLLKFGYEHIFQSYKKNN